MRVTVLKPSLWAVQILKISPIVISNQRYSSNVWSVPLKKEKISESLQLQSIQSADTSNDRPLVLLFGWLLANPRHLNKYANLYHSKGYDVLVQQTKPLDILLPRKCQESMDNLLAILVKNNMNKKPILIHGFSVGAYVYGEMLVKMYEQQDRWERVQKRVVGQIFDSPVDFDQVPFGFSNAVLKNKQAQKILQSILELYLRITYNSITKHYERSSKTLIANKMRSPSLMLYSRADPVGVDHRIEEVMQQWRERGITVSGRCWQSSPHVSHFHRHPDEYVEAVLNFLDVLGMSKNSQVLKNVKVSETVTKQQSEAQQQQAL